MGARFDKLVGELTAKGAADPAALAAWIGKKKYGKAGFQKLAEAGRKVHGDKAHRASDLLMSLDDGYMHFRAGLADLDLKPGGDGRTIHGIAVPFNRPQRIDDTLIEAFDPHALDHQLRAMHRVGYWNLHSNHPEGIEVGHIKEARIDGSAGLYTESYVRRGEEGDRTLDDIRSGRRPHQSVGFEAGPSGTQMRDGVAYRTKVNLFELAAVPVGAYGAAASVMAVRAAVSVCAVCGHGSTPELRAVGRSTRDADVILAGLPALR